MIALAIAAVVALAGFSVAAAVLTTVATSRPDRAAAIVVVAAAVGAVSLVTLVLLAVGVGGVESALDTAAGRRVGPVDIHPVRATVGLSTAGVLLAIAVRLVWTGDWARVDTGERPEPGAPKPDEQ